MNQFSGYLIVLVVSAGITFGFAHLARRVGVKYGLHPPIRERDVHQTPTPRLGGVAMFIGILVAFGVAWQLPFFDLVFADPEPVREVLIEVYDALGLDWDPTTVGAVQTTVPGAQIEDVRAAVLRAYGQLATLRSRLVIGR